MSRRIWAVTLISFAIVTTGLAHEGAKGAVKVRMDAMKDIGAQTKIIGTGLRSGDFDAEALLAASEAIAAHAAMISIQFEEKDMTAPSESAPAIWENFADFKLEASALEAAARAFGEQLKADASADVLRSAFADIGKTCSSCHKTYRLSQ